MDEPWPNPDSIFSLRDHLERDHGEKMSTAGWHECDQNHRHLHRVGADHTHDKAAMV